MNVVFQARCEGMKVKRTMVQNDTQLKPQKFNFSISYIDELLSLNANNTDFNKHIEHIYAEELKHK
jgi:hypothetical protein